MQAPSRPPLSSLHEAAGLRHPRIAALDPLRFAGSALRLGRRRVLEKASALALVGIPLVPRQTRTFRSRRLAGVRRSCESSEYENSDDLEHWDPQLLG